MTTMHALVGAGAVAFVLGVLALCRWRFREADLERLATQAGLDGYRRR